MTTLTEPPWPPAAETLELFEQALDVLADRPLLVLTGAGISTDSGIPDYRGPGSPNRTPMTYQDFVAGPQAQRRSTLTITQNVDGLHEAAGSRQLCALHGRVADVICLGCRSVTSRAALAQRLDELNPGWLEAHADVASRPDGDVDLEDTAGFVVPPCDGCGGVLKPDVVFFGENVPKPRVERCYAAVEALADCDGALLVLGSSLTVMSGFRFVRTAAKLGVPVVIVNRGTTRADDLATVKLHAGTSEFATALVGC